MSELDAVSKVVKAWLRSSFTTLVDSNPANWSFVSLRLFLMINWWFRPYEGSFVSLATLSCSSRSLILQASISRVCMFRWLMMYVFRSAIWNSNDLTWVLRDLISYWYYSASLLRWCSSLMPSLILNLIYWAKVWWRPNLEDMNWRWLNVPY